MSIKKLLAAAGMILVMAAAVCGCYVPASQQETVYIPDYTEAVSLITTYEDSYRSFVQNGEGQVSVVTASGYTPLGSERSSRYICSSDGAFESCSLVVTRDIEEHDEYFNLNNGLMMFVRTHTDADGVLFIDKYICAGENVYYVNDETQTMDQITDITALDCFVTFDQVRRVYGEPVDTTATQLPA